MEIEKITFCHSRIGWVILLREENPLTRSLRLSTEKVVSEPLFEESERNRMDLKNQRCKKSVNHFDVHLLPPQYRQQSDREKSTRDTHQVHSSPSFRRGFSKRISVSSSIVLNTWSSFLRSVRSSSGFSEVSRTYRSPWMLE